VKITKCQEIAASASTPAPERRAARELASQLIAKHGVHEQEIEAMRDSAVRGLRGLQHLPGVEFHKRVIRLLSHLRRVKNMAIVVTHDEDATQMLIEAEKVLEVFEAHAHAL
jgi:hypothetical protein